MVKLMIARVSPDRVVIMVRAARIGTAMAALLLAVGVYAATEIELEPAGNDPGQHQVVAKRRPKFHELLCRLSFGQVRSIQYARARS